MMSNNSTKKYAEICFKIQLTDNILYSIFGSCPSSNLHKWRKDREEEEDRWV